MARGVHWAIALLLGVWLMGCQPQTMRVGEPVTIKTVLSGQTVAVLWRNEALTVRLAGIDAPDRRQAPWGEQARAALTQQLAAPEPLYLEPSDPERDRYGRQWGYLWQGDRLINIWLVEQGYVLARREPMAAYTEQLSHAQDYARMMATGIWQPDNPLRQTPQEFRAQGAAAEN
ncbi:MAG: thermonuclease family protein [Cyanobacteria bacterium P01_G01_bin.54]